MTEKIKELPDSERPYERCEELGPESLSDAELLAVILRTGSREMSSLDIARDILKKAGNGESIAGIEHIGDDELLKIPGIGRVKLILLKCLTEYSKRLWKARIKGNIRFLEPKECASYFMEDLRYLKQEVVMAVLLDSRANFTGSKMITKGLSDCSLISPKELFSYALKNNAAQVIILHNHPGGDPSPSREDLRTVKNLIEAGEIVGVSLADSIIIGDGTFVSLRKNYKSFWEENKEA